jgi:hypothetical protein
VYVWGEWGERERVGGRERQKKESIKGREVAGEREREKRIKENKLHRLTFMLELLDSISYQE